MKNVEGVEARIIHRDRSEEKANLYRSWWKSPKTEPRENMPWLATSDRCPFGEPYAFPEEISLYD